MMKLHKEETRALNQELDLEREKFDKNLKSFEDFKKEWSSKIEFERKHFREQQKMLEASLEDAKLAISGNSEEYTNIQKKLRQENLELTRQIAEINQKPPPMHVIQPDITGIKEAINQIIKDSQKVKEEKALAELKLEYEMKINSNY